jgi:hypothetical protein
MTTGLTFQLIVTTETLLTTRYGSRSVIVSNALIYPLRVLRDVRRQQRDVGRYESHEVGVPSRTSHFAPPSQLQTTSLLSGLHGYNMPHENQQELRLDHLSCAKLSRSILKSVYIIVIFLN